MRFDPDKATAIAVGIRETYDNQTVDYHTHQRAQLMFARQGLMNVKTQEGLWMLPPTRALFLPGKISHALQCMGTVKLATIYISSDVTDIQSWQTSRVINVSPLMREVILRLVDAPWDYDESAKENRLTHVLLDEIELEPGLPYYLPEPSDPRAKRFCAHMRDNINDRRRITAISQSLGTTARTLERCFKRDVGMSVGSWVQQLRLLVAVQHITLGNSVSDIAFELGYSNPSSFIAAFRAAFNTSPGKFVGS